MKTEGVLTLTEITSRINRHLKRFESNPTINVSREHGGKRYYYAGAYRAGRYVGVRYVSYQGSDNLTREQAEKYLEKLDAGFVGRHFEALREES